MSEARPLLLVSHFAAVGAGLEASPREYVARYSKSASTDVKRAMRRRKKGKLKRGKGGKGGAVQGRRQAIAIGLSEARKKGKLREFQARLKAIAEFAANRVENIKSFDDVSLLTVKVDRLKRWAKRGLLCIGDAAHAMSPVGGVGINLAIQDAVAASNAIAPVLLHKNALSQNHLDRVQRRRDWPTKVIQLFQLVVQNRVLAPGLQSQSTPKPPLPLRLLNRWTWLRQFPARFIGIGPRPEHIQTPDCLARTHAR